MKSKRLAIAGMTGALLIGAGTGVVLNLPSSAGAGANTVAAATTPTDPAAVATDSAAPTGGPHQLLQDSLATLVSDGTITQAQADAITAATEANRPTGGPGMGDGDGDHAGRGHGGPGMGGPGMGGPGNGGPGMGGRHGGAGLDTAATALGMTADELRTELQGGKTIAQVATDKGVELQKVIDVMVAEATTRITDMVNGVKPAAPVDQDATSSTTATNG
ncbi:unannotated protein [freshwater metagenome]|uniref:Unannotated protein n=1 Tax=freshwater metagenome TaxID=449393 RepID=A0A6J7EJF8_9ZZZZ